MLRIPQLLQLCLLYSSSGLPTDLLRRLQCAHLLSVLLLLIMLNARESRAVTDELASALAQKLKVWQPALMEELAIWVAVNADAVDVGASPAPAGDAKHTASEAAQSFVEAVRSFITEWLSVREIGAPEFGVIAAAAEKRAMEMLEDAGSET
ncbi:MAG: hypothetical protein ACYDEN_09340 [Acidimicrobiales bacterium]